MWPLRAFHRNWDLGAIPWVVFGDNLGVSLGGSQALSRTPREVPRLGGGDVPEDTPSRIFMEGVSSKRAFGHVSLQFLDFTGRLENAQGDGVQNHILPSLFFYRPMASCEELLDALPPHFPKSDRSA